MTAGDALPGGRFAAGGEASRLTPHLMAGPENRGRLFLLQLIEALL